MGGYGLISMVALSGYMDRGSNSSSNNSKVEVEEVLNDKQSGYNGRAQWLGGEGWTVWHKSGLYHGCRLRNVRPAKF